MTASRVQLLDAPSPMIVEGRSRATLLSSTACRRCCRARLPVADDEVEGTARGAWMLMHWNEATGRDL
jgi:hypothetical protein